MISFTSLSMRPCRSGSWEQYFPYARHAGDNRDAVRSLEIVGWMLGIEGEWEEKNQTEKLPRPISVARNLCMLRPVLSHLVIAPDISSSISYLPSDMTPVSKTQAWSVASSPSYSQELEANERVASDLCKARHQRCMCSWIGWPVGPSD